MTTTKISVTAVKLVIVLQLHNVRRTADIAVSLLIATPARPPTTRQLLKTSSNLYCCLDAFLGHFFRILLQSG